MPINSMYKIPKHVINLFICLGIFINGDVTDAKTTKIKASQLPNETFTKTVIHRNVNKILSNRLSSPFGLLNQSIILFFILFFTQLNFIALITKNFKN